MIQTSLEMLGAYADEDFIWERFPTLQTNSKVNNC